jgi:hypothetical protein
MTGKPIVATTDGMMPESIDRSTAIVDRETSVIRFEVFVKHHGALRICFTLGRRHIDRQQLSAVQRLEDQPPSIRVVALFQSFA